MSTYTRIPRISCPYCRSETCRHPTRYDEIERTEWLLEHTGRDVLHVFAREHRGGLVYDCPICGDQHGHGLAYGSRATHCPVGVPMTVVLHRAEGDDPDNDNLKEDA